MKVTKLMSERIIKSVNDNVSKQQTYKKLLGRYKLAIKNDFYFEAMIIVYAMLEDRLRSVLYHTGVLINKDKLLVHKKTKLYVKNIVATYQEGDKVSLGMKNITGKMNIIEAMFNWATECENPEDKYLVLLKSTIETTDIGAVLETIDNLKGWLKYRNEVIHAAMNKDIDSLFSDLSERVEEGMRYARLIDNQSAVLRKKSLIRKKMNMGNN